VSSLEQSRPARTNEMYLSHARPTLAQSVAAVFTQEKVEEWPASCMWHGEPKFSKQMIVCSVLLQVR
jgi:hypothetical protein